LCATEEHDHVAAWNTLLSIDLILNDVYDDILSLATCLFGVKETCSDAMHSCCMLRYPASARSRAAIFHGFLAVVIGLVHNIRWRENIAWI
jgi:hypothetical protein